ncbi:Phospholipid-transporting ATPase IB [Halotydeus destructor]|nr:Phospholipid-transporting ATPase IB [Halotydeus destructor]
MERLQEESSTITNMTPTTGHHQLPPRVVYVLGKHKYCSNKITTAKYNVFSFLPKFLFEQFRRYANVFFLFIALMQQIPGVSPTGRYTTAVPLFCILAVSAIKEIFEDIKRHNADRSVNRSKTGILNNAGVTPQWERKHWFQVNVGDIVRVANDNFFPSDLLLLASSEPNGMCYIETANLDGETNLKIRQSLAATFECVTSDKLVQDLSMASIECDPPNKHLYEFKGNLKVGDKIYPVTPDQILLRGAKLKNCNWVFGCVLYTGHESKLMMNSMLQSPLKQSHVDKVTNTHILSLFAILVAISAISAVASYIWNYDNHHWYVSGAKDFSSNPLFTFLTFMILYNNLIPISLQVTLEVVRFIQAHFINSDLEMYCEETDTPAMARTSNLNEELGQIRYILSDKTGTLTRNIMEFKKTTVNGVLYEEYEAEKMIQVIRTGQPQNQLYMREFLTLLSVCHTVVPDLHSEEENGDGEVKYQAASPDEGALVKGVAKLGFKFTTRTPQFVFISALGEEEKYEILNVLEFTSDRKRMSVVIRSPDGKIKIYVKGADTVINERLADNLRAAILEKTMDHLEEFRLSWPSNAVLCLRDH